MNISNRFCNVRLSPDLKKSRCNSLLVGIGNSEGITAHDFCIASLQESCPHRVDLEVDDIPGLLQGSTIVAGFRVHELITLNEKRLIDLLPRIRIWELDILWAYATDYTKRHIPWLVTLQSENFILWKKREV